MIATRGAIESLHVCIPVKSINELAETFAVEAAARVQAVLAGEQATQDREAEAALQPALIATLLDEIKWTTADTHCDIL